MPHVLFVFAFSGFASYDLCIFVRDCLTTVAALYWARARRQLLLLLCAKAVRVWLQLS